MAKNKETILFDDGKHTSTYADFNQLYEDQDPDEVYYVAPIVTFHENKKRVEKHATVWGVYLGGMISVGAALGKLAVDAIVEHVKEKKAKKKL